MKKTSQAGLILGMIILTGSSFAQSMDSVSVNGMRPARPKTYLDLVLNLVSTNINYGKANESLADFKKTVLGGQLGASFQAGITSSFSLVSEFYFIMKGGQLKANNPLTSAGSTLRFYTLELPILARYHFGRYYVNAGPSIAYQVYGTKRTEDITTSLSFNDAVGGFRRLDVAIQAGAGYRFHVKKRSLVLDVRYSYGLTNISHSEEMYNRYLNVSLHVSNPWKSNPFGRNRKGK
ncbi:MAG TPA: porin family protein [Cyclobacteriaceae bacterium]|nr:porin family protein [Cyclobacteriaceae bacterium]